MPRPDDFREADHTGFAFKMLHEQDERIARIDVHTGPDVARENIYAMSYFVDHVPADWPEGWSAACLVLADVHAARDLAGIHDPWPTVLAALAIPAEFWRARPTPGAVYRRILDGVTDR